jgi:hypothetical protein
MVDVTRGEGLFSFYLAHEQRLLWDTFWADYLSALPFMYVSVGGLTAVLVLALRWSGRTSGTGEAVGLMGFFGWSSAWYLSGNPMGSMHVALALAGAVLGGLVGLSLRNSGAS